MSPTDQPTIERMNEFVRLVLRDQRRLFQYLHLLLPGEQDVEDVLQESLIVLWKKFDQYESGTSFFAWASRVAYLEMLAFRRRAGASPSILDDEVLALIAGEAVDELPQSDTRHAALAACLEKLRPADRELIERRYAPGARRNDLARELGRPANSVSKSLGRIRQTLWECVTRTVARLGEEGAT